VGVVIVSRESRLYCNNGDGVHAYDTSLSAGTLDTIAHVALVTLTFEYATPRYLLFKNTLGIDMTHWYVATVPHDTIADRGGSFITPVAPGGVWPSLTRSTLE